VADVSVKPAPAAFTVALSREAGANGAVIAGRLGDRLGWAVYDRALLDWIAGEMGLRTSLLESVDEKRVSWLRECVEAFASAPGVTGGAFVRHLVEMMLSLATHGECVIVGRGAAQLLPAATTLRVRLVADPRDRVAVIRQRLGLSEGEAVRWVETTDRERDRFVRDHFHKDPADPRGYDLVLNASRFSVDECAEVIEEALLRLQAPARALPAVKPPAAVATPVGV
jgi:cytidylate kinase